VAASNRSRVTSIAIITDADSCVPTALQATLGIHTAPADPPLLLEHESIPRLRSEASEVTPDDALAACKAAIEAGTTDLLYLAASDGYGSAPDLEAALDGLEAHVLTEASGAALMGAGWQAIAAAEAIRDGGSLEDALAAARRVRSTVEVLAMLEHPEMATALGNSELESSRRRALVKLRGPEISIINRPKSREDALPALRDLFAQSVGDPSRTHVAVHHAAAGPGAEALARWIERELSPARVLVAPLTRHAAARLGPRMLGVAWYQT